MPYFNYSFGTCLFIKNGYNSYSRVYLQIMSSCIFFLEKQSLYHEIIFNDDFYQNKKNKDRDENAEDKGSFTSL